MAYNTKPIKIVFGKPIPQHFNPTIDDYEALLGDKGASRHVLYDVNGNPLSVVSGKLAVRASEIEALLTGLPTAKTPSGNLKTAVVEALPTGDNNIGNVDVVSSALPTGAATAAKQDSIISYVDTLEALITAIRDTAGIKKITDTVNSDIVDKAARILGKITADDNAIAALGALAATAVTDPAASASGIALLKGLLKQLQGTGSGSQPVNLSNPIPSGDNNIGNIDIVSTHVDATPGSAHPAKAIMVAGSDGVNAQRIKTDTNGVVQVQLIQTTQEVSMLASAARTTSGDTSATPTDVKKYKEAIFFLDVTAASGATPTLDVKIKTKDPVSGKWFDLISFTQATAITSEMKAVSGLLGSQIAAFYTISGDAPSFTFSLSAVLKS